MNEAIQWLGSDSVKIWSLGKNSELSFQVYHLLGLPYQSALSTSTWPACTRTRIPDSGKSSRTCLTSATWATDSFTALTRRRTRQKLSGIRKRRRRRAPTTEVRFGRCRGTSGDVGGRRGTSGDVGLFYISSSGKMRTKKILSNRTQAKWSHKKPGFYWRVDLFKKIQVQVQLKKMLN